MPEEQDRCYCCTIEIPKDDCCVFRNNLLQTRVYLCSKCTTSNVDEALKDIWYSISEYELKLGKIWICPYCDRDIIDNPAYSCYLYKEKISFMVPMHQDCFDANIGIPL